MDNSHKSFIKNLILTNTFVKDYVKVLKRGKDSAKMDRATEMLTFSTPIPIKYRDHFLVGNYVGYRELHIEPDWLLIYKTNSKEVTLYRTGTHSDLF